MIAWVVDTGRPVFEAKSTHAVAPIVTEARNAVLPSGRARKPLPENVATRPWLAKADSSPPATVQTVPHATARR